MSIEDYKWGDRKVDSVIDFGDGLDFYISHCDCCFDFSINEADAIAIAKHFNQDRESLALGIEKVIECVKEGASADFIEHRLQNLINPINEGVKDE